MSYFTTIRYLSLSALVLGTLATARPALAAAASSSSTSFDSLVVPTAPLSLQDIKRAFDRQSGLDISTRIDEDGDLEILLADGVPVWVRDFGNDQFLVFTLIAVDDDARPDHVGNFIDVLNVGISDVEFGLTEQNRIVAATLVPASVFQSDEQIVGVYSAFLYSLVSRVPLLDSHNVLL